MNLKDFISSTLQSLPPDTEVEFDLGVVGSDEPKDIIVIDRWQDGASVISRIRFKATSGARQ